MKNIITAKLKFSRVLAAVIAAGTLTLIAACGGGSASPATALGAASSIPGVTPSSAAQPAWRLGGVYVGPWPPTQTPPAKWKTWTLPQLTTNDGYKFAFTLSFGPPLHYSIPQKSDDCQTSSPDERTDLPPGQYAIPWALTIHNLLQQQAPAGPPVIAITSPNSTIGDYNLTEINSYTWFDGSCEGMTLGAGSSATLYGMVSPSGATPQQIRNSILYVNYDGKEELSTAQFHAWLVTLLPNRALPAG